MFRLRFRFKNLFTRRFFIIYIKLKRSIINTDRFRISKYLNLKSELSMVNQRCCQFYYFIFNISLLISISRTGIIVMVSLLLHFHIVTDFHLPTDISFMVKFPPSFPHFSIDFLQQKIDNSLIFIYYFKETSAFTFIPVLNFFAMFLSRFTKSILIGSL